MTNITYAIMSNPSNASMIAFNAYAYTANAAQGPDSINWLNAVNTSAQVGWTNVSGWVVTPS